MAYVLPSAKKHWVTAEFSVRVVQGSRSSDNSSVASTVTLVFFVGGVTYAELAALRFLSSLNDGHEYVAATTNVVNGNSLIGSLIEPE